MSCCREGRSLWWWEKEGQDWRKEGRKRAEECREEEGGVSTLRTEVRRSRATCSGEGWRHQQGRDSGNIVAGGLGEREWEEEEGKTRQEVVSAGKGKPSREPASSLL